MPRDLFAGTFERKAAPRRSGWTIAGSLIAHLVVLAALLVLPVMSALDSYVVQARTIAFVVLPPPVMPAVPVPTPKTAAKVPENLNPEAAPSKPPVEPVTSEPARVEMGVPPGSLPIGRGGPAVPGMGSSPVILPPAPPPAVIQKPIRPGGDVSAPTRLFNVNPVYPPLAIAAKVDGRVTLEATIDETGVVRDVRVVQSIALLDQAAMDAVKRWRYTPTKLNGVAVPILLTVTVTFSLR